MRRTAVKPKPEEALDPLDGQFDVVEVPRAWIQRNGWPRSYRDLVKLAGVEMEGFKPLHARKGDLCMKSYQALDVAYFYEGSDDRALLYAQCWRS